MTKQRIQRDDGSIKPDYSGYCPKCMSPLVEKTTGTVDFDDRGWFYPSIFNCKNPKCQNTWTERFRVKQ